MNHSIERETVRQGGRYYVPAPIVYGVIVGLVLAAIGGGGTGLIAALKFDQALSKLESLPSAKTLVAQAENQQAIDRRQDQRIDRLEQKVFGMHPFHQDALMCAPRMPWPSPLRHPQIAQFVIKDRWWSS